MRSLPEESLQGKGQGMKGSVHEHQEHNNHLCETHLGLCRSCDVVFCVECGKEWGVVCKLRHASDWYTYTIPANTTATDIPYTTTCSHAL